MKTDMTSGAFGHQSTCTTPKRAAAVPIRNQTFVVTESRNSPVLSGFLFLPIRQEIHTFEAASAFFAKLPDLLEHLELKLSHVA